MTNVFEKFPVLETERLQLRKIDFSDENQIFTYLSDIEVMKYYGLEPATSLEDVRSEISWYQSIFENKTGIRWGITLKGKDEVIGSVGFLNLVHQHKRADIGYELHRSFWGQGIAGEALVAILQFGFEHMNLERIQALIEPPNTASTKLVKKYGFTNEGLLRNYEFSLGRFDDLYMFSLLRDDFYKESKSKFYVASSFKNIEGVRYVSHQLKEKGYVHTYDWTQNSRASTFEDLREIGLKEREAVMEADFLIALLPGGKGTHVEIGIALALGKPVYLYSPNGEVDNLETTSTFYHVPEVVKVDGSLDELVEFILLKN